MLHYNGIPIHDETRVERNAVVVQHRNQLGRVGLAIEHQQCAQLRVTVLLDDVDNVMLLDEFPHRIAERE